MTAAFPVAIGGPIEAAPPPVPDGTYDDLDERLYRRQARLSYSGAKVLLRSAAHYLVDRQNPKPSTEEQLFGQAFHGELLEPGRLHEMVVELPEDAPKRPTSVQLTAAKPSPKTLDAIAWWKDFDAMAGTRLVLEPDDARRIKGMLAAVRAHGGARRLLAQGRAEVSMLWTDARYQVPCKARFDFLRPDGGIVDVKTTNDASPDAFARTCASFEYPLQTAAYFSGCEHEMHATPPFWAWLVVERDEPYGVATYVAQADAILAGARKWDAALARYRDALDTGAWPAYPQTIEPLQMPRWYLRETVS